MGRYDGKRAVITGGADGIGFVTARLLVDEGAGMTVTGREATALERARRRLGPGVVTVTRDAAEFADIDMLVDDVTAAFGGLDALLICAGQTRSVPFEQMRPEVHDRLFAVNTRGASSSSRGSRSCSPTARAGSLSPRSPTPPASR